MSFRGVARLLIVVVVAGCLYSVYAPETAEKLAPAAGAYARKLHDLLPAGVRSGETKTAVVSPEPQQPKGPPPALVSVAEAKSADYPVYLDSLGQAQAYNTVTVRTRVDGQVMKIAFIEGQIVKAGDLLAQIDPRPFQATLDQAKAKKSQDEANLANAKLDQQRYSTLAKQSFATQQQLDTQNALVAQLTAAIAADSASIDAAQVQLDYTTIRAPITGRTGFRLIDEGNMVAATQQTGIVTIAQLQPIAVIFTAPEGEVTNINATLAAGAPLQVLARNSGGEKTLASGHLLLADNQVDVATGTIRLKAEFANEDNALWPGLAVSTRLTIGDLKDAVVVPTVAIQHGPNGLFVYVIDDKNRAAMRPVTVTHQDTEKAVVDKGVSAGDRVVTVGQYVLQPGTLVAIDTAANTGS
jgi:membrane fusion protein, multidrug efflux system